VEGEEVKDKDEEKRRRRCTARLVKHRGARRRSPSDRWTIMNVHIEPGSPVPRDDRCARRPIGRLCLPRLFSPDRKQTSDRRDTLRGCLKIRYPARERERERGGGWEGGRVVSVRETTNAFSAICNYAIDRQAVRARARERERERERPTIVFCVERLLRPEYEARWDANPVFGIHVFIVRRTDEGKQIRADSRIREPKRRRGSESPRSIDSASLTKETRRRGTRLIPRYKLSFCQSLMARFVSVGGAIAASKPAG